MVPPIGRCGVALGGTLASLVVLVPLFVFKGRTSFEVVQVALVWILGGIIGAYGFGTIVLMAGVVALPVSLFKNAGSTT